MLGVRNWLSSGDRVGGPNSKKRPVLQSIWGYKTPLLGEVSLEQEHEVVPLGDKDQGLLEHQHDRGGSRGSFPQRAPEHIH